MEITSGAYAYMGDGVVLEWNEDTQEIREFSPTGKNTGVTYGVADIDAFERIAQQTQEAIEADNALAREGR
jgi:hypothetical protein